MNNTDRQAHVRTYLPNVPRAESSFVVLFQRVESAPSAVSLEDDRHWIALQAANPRLHDAPILAVSNFGESTHTLSCRSDSYKQFALQESNLLHDDPIANPFNPALIWLLGVKGCIIAKDPTGHEHLLIARRGQATRIYGLMWESAPAGGVAPPRHTPQSHPLLITHDILRHTLAAECEEELGLHLDWSAARLVALTQDRIAHSYDIHFRLDLPGSINPHHPPVCSTGQRSWEYVDSAWLAKRDAAQFMKTSYSIITPTTQALLAQMSWLE